MANPSVEVKQRAVRFDCSVTSRGGAGSKIIKGGLTI
jgi:hypothetical protein